MHLNATRMQTQQIFDSMDFDGNGKLTIPEFASDFKEVTSTSEAELLRRNQVEREGIQAATGAINMDMYGDIGLPEG